MLGEIRAFFLANNVLEVETPILSQAGVCDPHLKNLSTEINDKQYYLQTSPEFAMKRLLCAGSGDIFQISKAFRDDEQGRLHNPEFTMIEWYRIGFDYFQLMNDVEDLVSNLIGIKDFQRITYQEAFLQTVGVDPFSADHNQLGKIAGNISGKTTKNDLLDLIMGMKVLPALKDAVFIYDYPADQAAMAKTRSNIAERFELIINGVELANGYTELTDPIEQQQRFDNENKQREAMGMETMQVDQHLLKAMSEGLPECAGVALGFDRLLMLIMNKQSLSEVMSFPIGVA